MTTPRLVAMLLAAASATALAQGDLDERVPYAQPYRRHSNQEWREIASPTPSRFGTEYIEVGRAAGWLRTLRIDVTAGTVHLRRVRVVFREGPAETFYLDRWLDRHRPTVYVDLGRPRVVEQLIVTTDRRPAGSYAIYGSSGRVAPPREVAGL